MKKLIFSAAVLAMAAIGAIKANQNNPVANDLSFENVEQVAQGEVYVYIPELENGLRCVFVPEFYNCRLDVGPYQACWDPINCR